MKVIKRNDEVIEFDNGVTVTYYHEQDCCENVYADFMALNDTGFDEDDHAEPIKIEPVKDAGFRINGYFVPCYNSQNGYYSSNLVIHIKSKDKCVTTTYDLYEMGCIKDDIY